MSACTRLTKAGGPCGRNRVFWQGVTALPDPQACRGHLTNAELTALEGHRQAVDAARQQHLNGDPACWSWSTSTSLAGEDGELLLAWHGDRCALCGLPADLVEDHDHGTGLVRGYLCRGCNTREGHYGAAGLYVKYRQHPPAAILGLAVRYIHPITGETAQPVLERPRKRWEETAGRGIL